MSWQVGAFSILAIALTAGFAWYERTRPDARVVALVGTLAAFAALGRIAFAALPNVKPTTDIVLISGYALGAAPGFVVGALAGLTSNFFFGQGPWTPWQMAAWGATGLIGAGLAVAVGHGAGRRRAGGSISRIPLALICGVVGFAFAAFQDVGDWINYSDHSAAQLGIYVGKGIGFDLVHAAGCFAFALAFGPAFARSLRRFGARLQVRWLPVGVAPAIVGLALIGQVALLARAAPARAATLSGYLLRAQHGDGGFGPAPGQPSSSLFSGWAGLGLAALGDNPGDVRRGGATVLDYVRSAAGSLADVGALERTILVARAAGVSATSFGGHDLVAQLQRQIRADGSVTEQVNLTSFAVLALRAADVKPAARTIAWLERQQDRDGGFSFATAGDSSDVDDTGAALEALAGRGGTAPRVQRRAVGFIRAQQNPDGGFPSNPGGDSNVQSTAWAVQGLISAGVDPVTVRRGGSSPLQFIRSLIDVDGHVRYSRTTDPTPVWVTAEAALALAGKPLPLAPVPPRLAAHAIAPGTATVALTAHRSCCAAGHHSSARTGSFTDHASDSPSVQRFAAVAGIATALLLAPVGLG
jgi:energy-coupling factor transport system substrate-specific component